MTIKKVSLVSGLVFLLCACASFGAPVTTTTQAVNKASAVIEEYDLVNISKECLGYNVNGKSKAYVVRVRKLNNKACGGDPDVEPTLFFLKIMKTDGRTTTTAYSTDGSFEPLSHQKQSLFYEK